MKTLCTSRDSRAVCRYILRNGWVVTAPTTLPEGPSREEGSNLWPAILYETCKAGAVVGGIGGIWWRGEIRSM